MKIIECTQCGSNELSVRDGLATCTYCRAQFASEELAQLTEEIPQPTPTQFDVVLRSAGDNKIQVIKEIRGITLLGLREAKELVDNAGRALVVVKVDADRANAVQATLERAGATTEIVPSGDDVPPPPPPAAGAQPVERPNLSRNASPVNPRRPWRRNG